MEEIEQIYTAALKRFAEGGMEAFTLTREEAEAVYAYRWIFEGNNPGSNLLIDLIVSIEKDCARGKRCAVCFRVDDPDCWEGC